jgi:tight adherence protein B
MQLNPELVIYGLIFIAVLVLVEGLYLTVFGKSISLNTKVSRRLALMQKGGGREEVLEQLRKEMSQHTKSRNIPIYSILANKAQKANIAFSPSQLMMVMVGLSVIAFIGLTVGTQTETPVRIAISLAMGIGGVYFWIDKKAKKRLALIEEQLPDAVELMVRSLRVGHPFSSAISMVAKEVPDPLGTEMGVIADEANYGREMSDSLKALAERMEMQDLRFLAVAVTIQQQAGGNLAEILDGLSKVIRSRFRLFRRAHPRSLFRLAPQTLVFLPRPLALLSVKPFALDELVARLKDLNGHIQRVARWRGACLCLRVRCVCVCVCVCLCGVWCVVLGCLW